MSKKVTIKRRIERVRSRINTTLASGNNSIVLHTAEDAKTLVRTIIQLHISASVSAGAQLEFACLVLHEEAGIPVLTPLLHYTTTH